jgi:hypothetical protein
MIQTPGAGERRESASNVVSNSAARPEPVDSPRHRVVLPMAALPRGLDQLALPRGRAPHPVPHSGDA